ncbi:hypothetical protein ADUPG1_011159 [Aduncisulcus paluster]|uniref:AMP-dependent synthetase/ligase domain-containing protein n=1 Tax=Aduncisulcus paluster TaxID=2918883 RepID=A0ABQ5JWL3_9EUKA|nr:hypothetical protein ADUPG1_011159 [Aduncisulcus paluster]
MSDSVSDKILDSLVESLLKDAKPNRNCIVLYISETIGTPNAVYYSHKALCSNISSILSHFSHCNFRLDRECIMCMIPFYTMFGILVRLSAFATGSKVVFPSWINSHKTIFEDLDLASPSVFACVPRVLNDLMKMVYESGKSSIVSMGLKASLKAGKERISSFKEKYSKLKHRWVREEKCHTAKGYFGSGRKISDALMYSVKNCLGGKAKVIICSGASLSPISFQFISSVFSVPIIQFYGTSLTGAVAGTSVYFPEETVVGTPLCGVSVRVVPIKHDIEAPLDGKEEEILICDLSHDPDTIVGEIQVKSDNSFSDMKTASSFGTNQFITSDGWVKTGDIGLFNSKTQDLAIMGKSGSKLRLSIGYTVNPILIARAISGNIPRARENTLSPARSTPLIHKSVPGSIRDGTVISSYNSGYLLGILSINPDCISCGDIMSERTLSKICMEIMGNSLRYGLRVFEIPACFVLTINEWMDCLPSGFSAQQKGKDLPKTCLLEGEIALTTSKNITKLYSDELSALQEIKESASIGAESPMWGGRQISSIQVDGTQFLFTVASDSMDIEGEGIE